MNLHQFLLILRARWRAAFLTFALIVLTTLVINLLMPERYTATASVIADVRAPDPIAGLVLGGIAAPTYMPTQVDVINSNRVAQKVVRMLGLDQSPAVRDEWIRDTDGEGNMLLWLTESLQARLDVKPSRDSNVIGISFDSPDPAFAAAGANAFAQAYVETSLEMKVEPARQSANWFEGQAKAARDALEKSQARISEYQQQKGLVSTDERIDVETAKLNDLSAQLTIVQALTADATGKQRVGAGSASLPEVLSNGVIVNLKTEIVAAETKLRELAEKLGANHPDYQRLGTLIAALNNQLAAETGRITRGFGAMRGVGQHKEAELRSAIEAQRRKLLELKNQRAELGVLLREGETAQRAYDAVSARFTQTSLESQATQTNVLLLTAASAPNRPSSPNLVLNLLIAVVAGTLLAVAAAFAREIGDRRVRTHEDLEATMGLPMLTRLDPQARRRSFPNLVSGMRSLKQIGGARRLEGTA